MVNLHVAKKSIINYNNDQKYKLQLVQKWKYAEKEMKAKGNEIKRIK